MFGEFRPHIAYFWLLLVGCNQFVNTKFSKPCQGDFGPYSFFIPPPDCLRQLRARQAQEGKLRRRQGRATRSR